MFWPFGKTEYLKPAGQPMPLFTTMEGEKLKQVKMCVELADCAADDAGFQPTSSVRRHLQYALKIIEGDNSGA